MQDKYYGFDPYEADPIDSNDYLVDRVDDDFIVEHLDEYISAIELQNAKEIRVSKANIERRRLKKKHEEQLRRRGILAFLAGTVTALALAFANPQVQGSDFLANKAYESMTEDGYGWRDDSQAGIIFNQNGSTVDYKTAINSIRNKLKSHGMSDADIDVALNAILHISPSDSTFGERVEARSNAYHQSKINEEGMSK